MLPSELETRPTVRPTTYLLVVVATAYALAYRFIPYDVQTYFLWPLAALGLFAGAKLRWLPALLVCFGVQIASDAIFYFTKQWDPVVYVYPCLLLNFFLGRGLLRSSPSAWRVGFVGMFSFVVFFVVTNVGSWVHTALPEYRPHTLNTMLLSLEQGLAFIRPRPGQWLGTPLFAIMLFGADLALARATASAPVKAR